MTTDRPLPVIPAPAQFEVAAGTFTVDLATGISVGDPSLLPVAERFRADLRTYAGLTLRGEEIEAAADHPGVRVELGDPGDGPRVTRGLRADGAAADGERHRLDVTEEGVTVVGATPEAVHRGLTTLLQLVAAGDGSVPCGRIADAPELAWRGLSLDVVRWFVPLDEVKRVVDVLALHKLNVLHLHLTDNEAWRLEIEGWPGLTDGVDGVYRQDELAELVAYARERFVTIVPEVDLPGHCAAVLAAYPQLGVLGADNGTPLRAAHLDPAVDETWTFVGDVVRQLGALCPSPFVHLGGDEAFGMDPAAYATFVDRAAEVVRAAGKRVVGWQETCRAGVGPDEVVQHWIDLSALLGGGGSDGSGGSAGPVLPADVRDVIVEHFAEALGDLDRIAAKGARLLLSPTPTFYLDQPHGDPSTDPAQEADRTRLGLQFYPPRTLAAMLDWDPAAAVGPVAPDVVVGVEAALWCETVRSAADLETLLLPRIAGVAQLGWGAGDRVGWEAHRSRLAALAPLWERAGWAWYRAAGVDWPAPRAH